MLAKIKLSNKKRRTSTYPLNKGPIQPPNNFGILKGKQEDKFTRTALNKSMTCLTLRYAIERKLLM